MKKFINKISFIIATKNRPTELSRLLQSFKVQSYRSDSIIIVDAGDGLAKDLMKDFPDLNIHYEKSSVSSAAKQRNIGLGILPPEINLVGFLDDDIVLEPDALELMMEFWEDAGSQIAGAAFNILNTSALQLARLKSLPLADKLGLYSEGKGKVLPSGFHTMLGQVSYITEVEWMPACTAIWRRHIFKEFKFDEWFTGYSYLEDLDFSYSVGKKYKIVVLAKPKCYHYPSSQGRESRYLFGKKEVLNRIYFVKKNKELSLLKCYFALFVRALISFVNFLSGSEKQSLQRIFGNITGIIMSIYKRNLVISKNDKVKE